MAIASKPRPTVGAVRRSFAPWTDPAAVPLIRYRNVTKAFGDFVAVNDVSLDIYEREFFALLGPSGCGKTTLMRMLAGFEEPTSGTISLGGQDLTGMPPHRRPANMMFQSYALFPHMSVADNIAFGLKMDGLPKSEIAARVDEMLALVRLEKFGSRKPHQLSGGQRQRVALARSLAKKPKVLLLDEPLGALDKKLREETQFELMDLQVQLGMTFLIVTHDQDEAMTVADRIAVMDQGRIVQTAPPAEMYEQPSCRYVAGFLGDVTLFECRVTAATDGTLALTNDQGANFVVTSGEDLKPGDTASLAIRPEKMAINLDPLPEGTPNVMAGTVWDIGYLGDWTTYLVEIEGGAKVRVARANATRFVERPITWEDPVWISFAPDSGVVLTR